MTTLDKLNRPKSEYIESFDLRLKQKSFEQFSILLCDPDSCQAQHKTLLERLLFSSEESHRCPQIWLDYINYSTKVYPDRKMQLQRLVNKAIDCVDESKHRATKQLLMLYLFSASLKRFVVL